MVYLTEKIQQKNIYTIYIYLASFTNHTSIKNSSLFWARSIEALLINGLFKETAY